MSAKELAIDFINLIFALIIISGAILYFIAGDNFEAFRIILASLSPIVFFIFLLLIKIRLSREEKKKRFDEGNIGINLRLNFFDKIKSDIFVFSLPIVICVIAFMANREVTIVNFFQAAIVFLIAFWYKSWLFAKEQI